MFIFVVAFTCQGTLSKVLRKNEVYLRPPPINELDLIMTRDTDNQNEGETDNDDEEDDNNERDVGFNQKLLDLEEEYSKGESGKAIEE